VHPESRDAHYPRLPLLEGKVSIEPVEPLDKGTFGDNLSGVQLPSRREHLSRPVPHRQAIWAADTQNPGGILEDVVSHLPAMVPDGTLGTCRSDGGRERFEHSR